MHMTGGSGTTGNVLYERRPKESYRETITYEIDMLTFCYDNCHKVGTAKEAMNTYPWKDSYFTIAICLNFSAANIGPVAMT
jgi:hypothetical protein